MIEAGLTAGSPLTLANGLTVPFNYNNGSNVIFQFDSLGPAGSPGLMVDNGLTNVGNVGSLPNTQEILITGAISGTGTYALIGTDPGGAGSLANGFSNNTFVLSSPLPNRAQGNLQINPTNPQELDLVVTGLYSVAWTGVGGSDWNALGNFVQMGGMDNYGKFQPGDAVVFSDSATITSVTLNSGNVAPSSVTFQNNLKTYTLSGTASITGNTGLSLTNGGTLIIENTNTYTGLTSIGPGATLQLGTGAGSDGALPNTTISDSGALVYSLTGQQTFTNPITGPGVLQLNSGAVTLTSTGNTFSGGTTILGGTLEIGVNTGPTSDGSLLGQVANNSLLVFDNYGPQTFGGTISGSGAVTKMGLGLLTFTNSSSYGGGTTISGGTLVLGNGQAGQDASLSGAVSDNSVFAFNYAANETFAGAISGNGALATLGSHTLTLTNIETYGGPTTISAGTLQLGNGIASGAVAGNIANNSALVFNSPSAQTYGGIISGSGSIATIGGNYLALTGKSTNSGSVTVSGGTLSLVGGSLYSNLNYVAGPVITVNNGGEIVVAAWSDADSNGNNGGFGQLGFTNTNLVINGGTIRYVGNGPNNGNTDRGFVMGASGATLDASGGATFTLSVGNRGLGIINNAANGPLTLEGTTNGLLGMAFSGASNLTKTVRAPGPSATATTPIPAAPRSTAAC